MTNTILAALAMAQTPSLAIKAEPQHGLTIVANGVPIARETWFQYYAPGWKKGYYSYLYAHDQKAEQIDANTTKVTFGSPTGPAFGTQTYRVEANTVTIESEFHTNLDEPVLVEATAAQLWTPVLEAGKGWSAEGPLRALSPTKYAKPQDLQPRLIADNTRQLRFEMPFGKLSVESSEPLRMIDGRGGFDQDWADETSLFWVGSEAIEVTKSKPALWKVKIMVDPREVVSAPAIQQTLAPRTANLTPSHAPKPQLIPAATTDLLNWKDLIKVPGGEPLILFRPEPSSKSTQYVFDPSMVVVSGGPAELEPAIQQRVKSLLWYRDGNWYLPSGKFTDQPKVSWRGVHLFVGPTAPGFHKKLWERVLLPMQFNHVVLQCERADWESFPNVRSSINISKPDLIELFRNYREMGVEPIPLIQSYGHMGWFFGNKKNTELAVNPDDPFAIDPLAPGTPEALDKLWTEVIGSLKPKTVHFGLDEVDLRGKQFSPEDKSLRLAKQLDTLGKIAQKHNVNGMFWGDQFLSPKEAVDAANADSQSRAIARRAMIPKGWTVADWHYRNDPKPSTFTPSLRVWKAEGRQAIASTWFRTDNIRGFALAAGEAGAGLLQTTWCGYESSEAGMLAALPQFSAMILAADYAFSGRQEPVNKLPYDPATVFRRMYFGDPVPAGAKGQQFGSAKAEDFGAGRFIPLQGLSLRSSLDEVSAADKAVLSVSGSGSRLALLVRCRYPALTGDPVAEVRVGNIKRTLRYGLDLRAASDPGTTAYGAPAAKGCYVVPIGLGGTKQVSEIEVQSLNSYSGLEIVGVSLITPTRKQ